MGGVSQVCCAKPHGVLSALSRVPNLSQPWYLLLSPPLEFTSLTLSISCGLI